LPIKKNPSDFAEDAFPFSDFLFPRLPLVKDLMSMNALKRKRSREEPSSARSVIIILEKAGLVLGREGLVDAFDRAASTEIANESLKEVRPDIVHQCLLAIFDSDVAYRRLACVYVSTIKGKTIEVSPRLRPPRTFARFKGLMSALLRDGFVKSTDGDVLLKVLPGSVAPIIPHGAMVTGISNSHSATILSASAVARVAYAAPVSNDLQGGVKNILGIFCVSCTDDCDFSGVDYITKEVCFSAYPLSSHVMCARLCEGFGRVMGPVVRDPTTTERNTDD
jgi:rRNA small subunit pseudouridine methyltransferase Nep1